MLVDMRERVGLAVKQHLLSSRDLEESTCATVWGFLMRAPRRRRPRKDDRFSLTPDVDLGVLAEKATYAPSPEHKDYLTIAGPGKLRSDASACPRGLDFSEVLEWLKTAIGEGFVSADFEGDFPRYVWARVDNQVYEARLSNSGLGVYKGYPIHDYEAPGWLP